MYELLVQVSSRYIRAKIYIRKYLIFFTVFYVSAVSNDPKLASISNFWLVSDLSTRKILVSLSNRSCGKPAQTAIWFTVWFKVCHEDIFRKGTVIDYKRRNTSCGFSLSKIPVVPLKPYRVTRGEKLHPVTVISSNQQVIWNMQKF